MWFLGLLIKQTIIFIFSIIIRSFPENIHSWLSVRAVAKREILAIFQIRKNMKTQEISEISISPQSHNPTIPQSPSFFPPALQPRIWAAAAWFREFVEKSKRGRQERLYPRKWSTVMKSLWSRRLLFSRDKVSHNSRRRKWSFVQ